MFQSHTWFQQFIISKSSLEICGGCTENNAASAQSVPVHFNFYFYSIKPPDQINIILLIDC